MVPALVRVAVRVILHAPCAARALARALPRERVPLGIFGERARAALAHPDGVLQARVRRLAVAARAREAERLPDALARVARIVLVVARDLVARVFRVVLLHLRVSHHRVGPSEEFFRLLAPVLLHVHEEVLAIHHTPRHGVRRGTAPDITPAPITIQRLSLTLRRVLERRARVVRVGRDPVVAVPVKHLQKILTRDSEKIETVAVQRSAFVAIRCSAELRRAAARRVSRRTCSPRTCRRTCRFLSSCSRTRNAP